MRSQKSATWSRYPAVLDLANFVVVSRPGITLDSIRERVPSAFRDRPSASTRVILVEAVHFRIHSTDIRRRVRAGQQPLWFRSRFSRPLHRGASSLLWTLIVMAKTTSQWTPRTTRAVGSKAIAKPRLPKVISAAIQRRRTGRPAASWCSTSRRRARSGLLRDCWRTTRGRRRRLRCGGRGFSRLSSSARRWWKATPRRVDLARLFRLRHPRLLEARPRLLRPRSSLGQRHAARISRRRIAGLGTWGSGLGQRPLPISYSPLSSSPPCAACKKPLRHPLSGAVCVDCWTSLRLAPRLLD